MRFATFSHTADGEPRLGVLVGDDAVLDLRLAVPDVPGDLRAYIAAGPELHARVQSIVYSGTPRADHVVPLSAVVLHAPLRPGKIVGVGLNYAEHVEESSRTLDTDARRPDRPVLFSKPATAVIGPDQPIEHNARMTAQLDWECELGVVIGETARSVPGARAFDHVFGYTVVNDISARDQRRSGQWFFSKGQDTYAPLGPIVVTADEIPDPHALGMELTVNGERRQKGTSAQMIFRIPELIEEITSGVTLEPGDVIATGSPQGVGAAMDPPTFLVPGDLVAATIEGIGTLSNPVKAV
ncbi:fumarylacetoacetate hydrolase family protein [Amycolatopsis sp. cg5]|uniref:fumarylacetoacetate hydrolase family protein n=1 Tax=Amycolatopsis sp. cg5 TaxID=3238802 RepID=UPI00352381DD